LKNWKSDNYPEFNAEISINWSKKQGFERSGNAEFKNFLIIAKGSNGEFRSQLYLCLDRRHIWQKKFDELYQNNTVLGKKVMSFIKYWQNSGLKGQSRRARDASNPQTSNLEH